MKKNDIDFEAVLVQCEMVNGKQQSFIATGIKLAKEVLKEDFDDVVSYKMWGIIDGGFNPLNMK